MRRHQQHHDREDNEDARLRLGAVLDRAAGRHRVARRQLGAERCDGAVQLLDDGGRLDAWHHVGLHSHRRQALPAPDQRRLERVGQRCDLRERNVASTRHLEPQIAQGLDLRPLLRHGARDDIDEVGRIAQLRDRGARQHRIDVVGQLLRADAEGTRAVLIDLDLDGLGGLVPVVVDVARAGIAADDLREGEGQLARLDRIGACDAELERPADRGTELQRTDARHDVVEIRCRECLLESGLDTRALLEAFGDDDGLGEEVVGELGVERQIEAHRALPDVEAPMGNVGVGFQDFLDTIDGIRCGAQRRALWQCQVDEQLGPVGRRKELLLHEAHADKGHGKDRRPSRPEQRTCGAAPDRASGGTSGKTTNARAAAWLFIVSGRM